MSTLNLTRKHRGYPRRCAEAPADQRVVIRVTAAERALLIDAAEVSGVISLSGFVRESALRAARAIMPRESGDADEALRRG